MSHSDANLVKEALEGLDDLSNYAAGKELGVSEGTVRRWREGNVGVPLQTDTRRALRRAVARRTDPQIVVREEAAGGHNRYEVPEPSPDGSPAEQLMYALGVRAGLRRMARELTTKDLITAAYTIALDDRWPPDEMRKLDAWRDAILAEEGES
jgi:hypothetical protein